MVEHLAVNALQLRPGFDTQLLDQVLTCGVVGAQRVGLPAGAIQGQHLLHAVPLPERVVRDQRADDGDDLVVLAEAQEGLDLVLASRCPHLVQPDRLGGEERLVHHVVQRLPAPERQRGAEVLERGLHVLAGSAGEPVASRGDGALEAVGVDGSRVEVEEVAPADGPERRRRTAGRELEGLAQVRHLDVERVHGVRRDVVSPTALDDDVGRDGAGAADEKREEHRPGAAPPNLHDLASPANLERPQEGELHEMGLYDGRGPL